MKISIITIVFNNKDHIGSCIRSVIEQTYKDIEYIVIDGGSSDGTQEVIEEYTGSLGYYVSEKDGGLYNALNKGIKKATGDVIGILHSDDIFYNKNTLSDIMNAFQVSKSDVVFAKGVFVDRNNIDKIKRIYESKPFKTWYLYWGWIPLHTGIYMRRDVFNKIGYYDEKYTIASDYDFSLRLFCSDLKTYYLNRFVVKMRMGGKSTTPSLQKTKSKEDLEIIRNHKLLGRFTLAFKIGRKVPQYIKPYFFK